jgi:hypothetical protein
MARDPFTLVFHSLKASQAYAQFDDSEIATKLFKLIDSIERDLIGSYIPSDRSQDSADEIEAAITEYLESLDEDNMVDPEPLIPEDVDDSDDEEPDEEPYIIVDVDDDELEETAEKDDDEDEPEEDVVIEEDD